MQTNIHQPSRPSPRGDGLSIWLGDLNNPYRDHIAGFLSREFFPANRGDHASVLEAVAEALLSTNRVRFGPLPSPENLVAIRAVIGSAISRNAPLRLLMPWGSKKADGGSPDVAEVGAFKTLAALAKRVRDHYSPGIEVVLRVEDLAGSYLWKDWGEKALEASTRYVSELAKLVRVLGLDYVDVKMETTLMDKKAFFETADEIRPVFLAYLNDSDAFGFDNEQLTSFKLLQSLGWKGAIDYDQRQFYRNRYAKDDPSLTLRQQNERLATYFSTVFARKKLRGYGSEPWGEDFVHLTFSPPTPGVPVGVMDRRVYYRTLPSTETNNHMSPWRSRGYLRIEGEKTTVKLANTTEAKVLPLDEATATFSRGGERVDVRVPHMVVS